MKTQEEPKQFEFLRSADSLLGASIQCLDGELGKVKDLLFDDQKWGMRYLVADAGKWLPGKKVLISPSHLGRPLNSAEGEKIPVILSKEQLKESPLLESDAPVSRRYEEEYRRYHGLSPYQYGAALWGATAYPMPPSRSDVAEHEVKVNEIEECTLRSCAEIMGYKVSATDGELGTIKDVVIDANQWKVRYLVLDIGNWLFGKQVLVDTDWVTRFDYEGQCAEVSLAKDQIKDAPVFDSAEPINRAYETTLYDFYGKPYYW